MLIIVQPQQEGPRVSRYEQGALTSLGRKLAAQESHIWTWDYLTGWFQIVPGQWDLDCRIVVADMRSRAVYRVLDDGSVGAELGDHKIFDYLPTELLITKHKRLRLD